MMKNIYKIIGIISFLLILIMFRRSAMAQQITPEEYILESRKYAESDLEKSLEIASQGLEAYPEDFDIMLHYIRVLAWNGQQEESDSLINLAANKWKNNRSVEELQLNLAYWSHQDDSLLARADHMLNIYGFYPDYLYLKAVALDHLGRSSESIAALKSLMNLYPDHESGQKLLTQLSVNRHRHGITLQVDYVGFDHQVRPWHMVRAGYWRSGNKLDFAGVIGAGTIFEQFTARIEIESYYRMSEKTYFYLASGYAPVAVTNKVYLAGEWFHMLNRSLEISAGIRYLGYKDSEAFLLTGQAGKYIGNNYIILRPFISYVGGQVTYFGNIGYRRYFRNQQFAGINLGYGYYLADISSIEMYEEMNSKGIFFDGRKNLGSKTHVLGSAGLQIEEIAVNQNRNRFNAAIKVVRTF